MSVRRSVLVALERAVYDAASQVEETDLRKHIATVLDGVYSADEDLPEAE